MNTTKILYWISTVLLCGIMLFSATMYVTKTEMIRSFFAKLDYPIYLVYPLAAAKVLGVIAILTKKSTLLKEWAYAGFFFDAALATVAHFHSQDGGHVLSLTALVLVVVSRFFDNKLFSTTS
jgi:hypothetical protein